MSGGGIWMPTSTRLALRLEEAIAGRAKANQVRKPADFVSQKSAEQTHVETREEIAKLAPESSASRSSFSAFSVMIDGVLGFAPGVPGVCCNY